MAAETWTAVSGIVPGRAVDGVEHPTSGDVLCFEVIGVDDRAAEMVIRVRRDFVEFAVAGSLVAVVNRDWLAAWLASPDARLAVDHVVLRPVFGGGPLHVRDVTVSVRDRVSMWKLAPSVLVTLRELV